ncbi:MULTISPECIES: hypothetical protein [unclassified Streptomyces]|uniref:hypothetical protein n=1 Tax=unclassified Streptomyces TaxID=2593676 RepID=UPI003812DC6F
MVANDLRHLHARALENADLGGPLAAIRRASLMAAAEKIPDLAMTPAATADFEVYLRDELAPDHAVSANDAGDFLRRIQRAVARLAKSRRSRLADVVRLFPEDFQVARFNVASAAFGSLSVKLTPNVDHAHDDVVSLDGPGWAEIGMAELIRALPETGEDEDSIDSLMGASPVVRRAVSDLIDGFNSEVSVGLTLTRRGGEKLRSQLTPGHAREIRRRLEVAREERVTAKMLGRLDGLRTRRQIFYFETKAGTEIHGYVDDSLIPAVKENLDRDVEVTLEVTVQRSQSGKVGQKHYRLLSVAGRQSEIPHMT